MADLVIKIAGDATKFQKELNLIKNQTKDLENQLASVAKVSAVAFAALTVVIVGSVKAFSDFEKGFTDVVTLLDQSSFKTKSLTAGIDGLKKGVLKLGAETGESFDALNKGLFDLISTGTDAEDAISSLDIATRLARAGATDTATAVKALSAATTAFGEEAGTTQAIAEKFFIAQKFGATTVGELAIGFNQIAGLAKSLGISFDEALASASALTLNGTKPTAIAFTEMKAVMNSVILAQSKLSKENPRVQKALSLTNIRAKGLNVALKEFVKAVDGDVVAIQKLLGSAEALGGVLALTGEQAEAVTTTMEAMGDEQERAAIFAEALATKNATTDQAIKRLTQTVRAAFIVIGEKFAPAINSAANSLSEFLQFLSENEGFTEFVAIAIAATTALTGLVTVSALAAIGFLKLRTAVIALGGATKLLKIAVRGLVGATGIGLLIVALGLLVENWEAIWDTMAEVLGSFVDTVKSILGGLGDIIAGVFSLDIGQIEKGFGQVTNSFKKELSEMEKAQQKADEEFKRSMADRSVAPIAAAAATPGGGELEPIDVAIARIAEIEAQAEAEKEAKIEALREEAEALREAKIEEAENDLEQNEELNEALNEQGAEFKEEFAALSLAERQEFAAQVIKANDNEKKVALILAKEKLKIQSDANLLFLKEQIKFGTAFATINRVINADEVQGVKRASGELVSLTQSRNSTLKAIGKVAAVANIGIKTAESAMNIFAGFSTIPFIGVALGIAGAAAAVAFGGERISNVLAAQAGGVATGGIPGRDSIPALLSPGELITPTQNFEETVTAVADQRLASEERDEEGVSQDIIIGFDGDEASQVLTARQNEDKALGVSEERAS